MRRRDAHQCLSDALEAARAIGRFLEGRALEDYLDDELLRSAVERKFEVLGEALGRALRLEPDLVKVLPSALGAVDFRNVVVHDYDQLSAEHVFNLAAEPLMTLAAEMEEELQRRR